MQNETAMTEQDKRVLLTRSISETEEISFEKISGESPVSRAAFKRFHEAMGKPEGKFWFCSMTAVDVLKQYR